MDPSIESLARFVVAASCISLMVVAAGVLIREFRAERPEPIERDNSPLALVNIVGIALFVVAGLALALSNSTTVALAEPWNAGLRIAGIVTLWAAGFLAIWGIRSIGRDMASQAEVRSDTSLVTSGAFGLVRHPLYLSILLLWAGGALALLSWALAIGAALLVPAFWARSRLEEQILTRYFGVAYTAYAARVPMLLPLPRPRR